MYAAPSRLTQEQKEDQQLNAQALEFVSSTKIDASIELIRDSLRYCTLAWLPVVRMQPSLGIFADLLSGGLSRSQRIQLIGPLAENILPFMTGCLFKLDCGTGSL